MDIHSTLSSWASTGVKMTVSAAMVFQATEQASTDQISSLPSTTKKISHVVEKVLTAGLLLGMSISWGVRTAIRWYREDLQSYPHSERVADIALVSTILVNSAVHYMSSLSLEDILCSEYSR